MIIYNKESLQNITVQEYANTAFKEGYIDESTKDNIITSHPTNLYTPNLFVKVGLGLLTTLIVFATGGLLWLIFNFDYLYTPCFLLSLFSYVSLEYIAGRKKHYNSGVDTMLMVLAGTFITGGLTSMLSNKGDDILISLILFAFSLWCLVRFVSTLAAIVSVVSLLLFIFHLYTFITKSTVDSSPYILIFISAAIYYLAKSREQRKKGSIYDSIYTIVKITALGALYLCGNFYFVDSITEQHFLLTGDFPVVNFWISWCWTFCIPVLLFAAGIKYKDIILLRIGVITMAVAILTFRNYYAVISMEVALTVAGLVLMATAYFLMNILKVRRHGFIYNSATNNKRRISDFEAFAVSQAFDTNHQGETGTRFGGGGFGGAGAGGSF